MSNPEAEQFRDKLQKTPQVEIGFPALPDESFELSDNIDKVMPWETMPSKSLQEEFFTDVLFFVCVFVLGLITGLTPWITVSVHALTSLAAGVILFFPDNSDVSKKNQAVILTLCASLAALVDALFIVQTICHALDMFDGEPTRFALNTRTNDTMLITVFAAAHATSGASAVYRARRSTGWTNAQMSKASMGVVFAASLVYVIWVSDFLGPYGTVRSFHFGMALLLFLLTLVELGFTLANNRDIDRQVWWINGVLLIVRYVLFVSNVSVLIDDKIVSVFSHQYHHRFGKAQGAALSGIVVAAAVSRVMLTTPASLECRESLKSSDSCQKTPAANADLEPVAYTIVTTIRLSGNIFPTTLALIAVFGSRDHSLSGFGLLLYVTFLHLRFWVQARSVQTWLFLSTSVLGIVVDVIVLFIDFRRWTIRGSNVLNAELKYTPDPSSFIYARDTTESVIITCIAVKCTFISVICIAHSASQFHKHRRSKHLKND
jgi:hypothetical protein